MKRLAEWGNALYTGEKSYDFVGRKKLWFSIAAVLVALSIVLPVLKGGFNMGIDFRGGSEFTVSQTSHTDVKPGEEAVTQVLPGSEPEVTNIAPGTVRIQTEKLTDQQTLQVKNNLIEAYGVSDDKVTSNFVGPPSSTLSRQLTALREAGGPTARTAAAREVARTLWTEMPSLPLYQRPEGVVVRGNLANYGALGPGTVDWTAVGYQADAE